MVTPGTRSRWIAVAVMSATFAAGVTVGVAAPRLFAKEPPAAEARTARAEHGERRERSSIFDRLNLSAEQQATRDSILEKRRRQMDAFWEEHGPAMRAIVDSTRAEIDRMLTPEQLQQMEEFREKRRKEREARESGERGPL